METNLWKYLKTKVFTKTRMEKITQREVSQIVKYITSVRENVACMGITRSAYKAIDGKHYVKKDVCLLESCAGYVVLSDFQGCLQPPSLSAPETSVNLFDTVQHPTRQSLSHSSS